VAETLRATKQRLDHTRIIFDSYFSHVRSWRGRDMRLLQRRYSTVSTAHYWPVLVYWLCCNHTICSDDPVPFSSGKGGRATKVSQAGSAGSGGWFSSHRVLRHGRTVCDSLAGEAGGMGNGECLSCFSCCASPFTLWGWR
jgi:hypothetical protein